MFHSIFSASEKKIQRTKPGDILSKCKCGQDDIDAGMVSVWLRDDGQRL